MENCSLEFSSIQETFFRLQSLAIRRSVIDGTKLNPIGFKIGFEVMARGHWKKVVEVPYTFRDREHGTSKFGQREIFQYVKQLGQVARDRLTRRT